MSYICTGIPIYTKFIVKNYSGYLPIPVQPLVLAIDSDVDCLELITMLLNLHDCSVITATDGSKALQIVQEKEFSLIITELMLPEVNGMDIARYLRENGNNTSIIAFTSLPSDLFCEQALSAGCNEYIEKPAQIEELEAAITHYLHPLSCLFLALE